MTMNQQHQLKRTFMKVEAYQFLREWIITGKLEPGERLRNQDLSETLGISRTPVREALLQLENEGLVITKANRWTVVAPIDLENAKEVYSVVWSLECLAFEQALSRFTQDHIDEMEKLNKQMNAIMEMDDKVKALELDNAFHQKIIEVSNNTELQKLLQGQKTKIQRIEIRYFSQNHAMNASCSEHNQILDAIKNKDLKQGLNAIRSNWENSLTRIILNSQLKA
ncbi:Fatty acid metabolism regulator protein [Bacillus velezensis]|nr:Fatty acid metabolism regulator protein [Bacillus velezensis]